MSIAQQLRHRLASEHLREYTPAELVSLARREINSPNSPRELVMIQQLLSVWLAKTTAFVEHYPSACEVCE